MSNNNTFNLSGIYSQNSMMVDENINHNHTPIKSFHRYNDDDTNNNNNNNTNNNNNNGSSPYVMDYSPNVNKQHGTSSFQFHHQPFSNSSNNNNNNNNNNNSNSNTISVDNTPQHHNVYDRFIPTSTPKDDITAQFNLKDQIDRRKQSSLDPETLAYQQQVAKACGFNIDQRILAFNTEAPAPKRNDFITTAWNKPLRPPNTSISMRKIQTEPEKILDAPGLNDDYYLNILDWSSKNIVAIALRNDIYLWNGETGEAILLCNIKGNSYVSSIQWAPDSSHLAIGLSEGDIEIWSIETQQKIRTMRGRPVRVGVMSWDLAMLSSGARDGSIWHHDVRVANHKTAELLRHDGDICGLKWRQDGQHLASGGNDNLVCVWDVRTTVPRFVKAEHTAAVKALAWCPWQLNTLASGGGTHDRHVHFWNTTTNNKIASVDTESQVTSIQWSLEYKEFLTCHGYPNNHISIWKYPSLTRIGDLPGHEQRILHSSLSPDGQIVATGASDENLKFWKIWETRRSKKNIDDLVMSRSGMGNMDNRNFQIR